MRRRSMIPVVLALIAPAAAAAETDERGTAFLQLAQREAAAWTLAIEGRDENALTLEKDPLLRWTNPVAGELYGGVFLWTDRGCPAAIAAVYKWYAPFTHLSAEFHSLSAAPLVGHGPDQGRWSPGHAGIEWSPVPEAPSPGGSPAQRLREMRTLLRDFTADQTDRDGERREMRLLAQPLWRFKSENPDVLDGGVFAFVEGTDPEIILLLAARRTKDTDEHDWHYAAARLNSVQLRLQHRGETIWEAPELAWRTVGDPREPYWARRREVNQVRP